MCTIYACVAILVLLLPSTPSTRTVKRAYIVFRPKLPTRPISRSFVSMTTMVELCSQSILQKSSVVSARGP